MPRISRNSLTSTYYHAIVQGINKEYIFKEDKDKETYREIIKNKLNNERITILGYCIMSNHAHFIINSEIVEDMSKYMHKINAIYAMYYNKKNRRVGYVFRNRYYTQEIKSRIQLYNCLKYVHNNPVKAKMVKKISEYKYSSYNEFLKKKNIITDESITKLFGSKKDFIEQFEWIHNNCNNDDFIDVKEKELDEFMHEVEIKYNKKLNELKDNKQLLKKIILDARKETDATIVEISEVLGVSKSTVGNYAKK